MHELKFNTSTNVNIGVLVSGGRNRVGPGLMNWNCPRAQEKKSTEKRNNVNTAVYTHKDPIQSRSDWPGRRPERNVCLWSLLKTAPGIYNWQTDDPKSGRGGVIGQIGGRPAGNALIGNLFGICPQHLTKKKHWYSYKRNGQKIKNIVVSC